MYIKNKLIFNLLHLKINISEKRLLCLLPLDSSLRPVWKLWRKFIFMLCWMFLCIRKGSFTSFKNTACFQCKHECLGLRIIIKHYEEIKELWALQVMINIRLRISPEYLNYFSVSSRQWFSSLVQLWAIA